MVTTRSKIRSPTRTPVAVTRLVARVVVQAMVAAAEPLRAKGWVKLTVTRPEPTRRDGVGCVVVGAGAGCDAGGEVAVEVVVDEVVVDESTTAGVVMATVETEVDVLPVIAAEWHPVSATVQAKVTAPMADRRVERRSRVMPHHRSTTTRQRIRAGEASQVEDSDRALVAGAGPR